MENASKALTMAGRIITSNNNYRSTNVCCSKYSKSKKSRRRQRNS